MWRTGGRSSSAPSRKRESRRHRFRKARSRSTPIRPRNDRSGRSSWPLTNGSIMKRVGPEVGLPGYIERAVRMSTTEIQYISDAEGNNVSVIVPIDLWREIESERETAYLLRSKAMKRRLLESKE